MKTIYKTGGNFDKKECFVHARACALNSNDIIMTMQKLNVQGSDYFGCLHVSKSFDGGKTWSSPACENSLYISDTDFAVDAYPYYSKFHKKAIVMGVVVTYLPDGSQMPQKNTRAFYSVFDEETGHFKPIKRLSVPDEELSVCYPSSAQITETKDGKLLIPVNIKKTTDTITSSCMMQCSFDGETLTFESFGNFISYELERGLYEPSVCFFNNKYYMTMRNDVYGFVSVSDDGLNFSEPEIWKWDNGEILPNYNTQQHWLVYDGKLHLVYTRRAENNSHVFRHRAPLFMSEVDTSSVSLIRETEQIVVPERGARLGNFGTCELPDGSCLITAAEWMQPEGCEKYGSDNTVFITKLTKN